MLPLLCAVLRPKEGGIFLWLEKKTGKRLLTWVLVLVMALSLLPLNALATDDPETGGGSGMNFDKRADSNDDGTYTITMTAQATGTTTTTTEVKPMDIALVLDVSGSMDDTIPRRYKAIDADDVVTNETYYVYAKHHFIVTWHSYDKVTYCNDCKAFVDSAESHIIHKIGISLGLKHKYSPSETQFYTAIKPIEKIDALKEAVNGFIDQVAKNSADSSIAVVSFASGAANVSDGLQSVNTKAETLKAAVNGLKAYGATRADLGMEEAASILKDGTNEKKVVIMFTDGEPTSGNKFEEDVANATISAAKGMKDEETEVFTVGVFDSAPDDKTYEYMNYVSSNYPQAQSMSKPGESSDNDYYTTADSADSLSKVFEGISQTITKPAPVNDKLDEKTVITDKLTDYFTFALTEDGKMDVKVYAKKGNEETDITGQVKITPDPQAKTVTVTGYDFSKYYVGSDDAETLVIKIKVKPSGVGCATEEIPTNADTAEKHAAKVEVKSEDGTEPTFVTSHKTAKVTGHKVIYDLNGGTGSITDKDLYYPQDAVVAVTNSVPTLEGYEFTGWKSDIKDDDTVYTSNGTNSSITMPAANVILKAQWKKIETPEPTPATVTLKETDVNGNALINKHLTITAKEVETIKDAYFCVAVTAADNTTEAAFNTEPRYATTTTVERMTRTSDGTAVEGSFVFPEQSVLTFSEVGTYTFTVKEVFDEYIKVNHTTYDDAEYTMTVTVTKDTTENKLNAAVSFSKDGQTEPTTSITFNNTYKTPVIPTYTFDLNDSDIITVNKKFESKYGLGSPMMRFTATATIEKKDTFTAEVDPDLPINPYPDNRSAVTGEPTYTNVGEVTGTVTLETDKKPKAFDFGKDSNGKDSKFQLEPGDYRITVEETNKGNDRYVNYDTEPYTHTYEFTVDNKGQISIKTPITFTITNEYTKRHTAATPSKPTLNTGDHYAYVMGYPDGTVRPNGSITRAEVSAILFRLLSDKTRDEYFTTESSFTDVKAGAWYNNSIATLEKAGVIVDTAKGGAFRPNEAITRAELAAMLAQFSDAKPVKGVKFSDVSAEHWAYEAIAIAAKMGWIEGYPDGTFRPDATITRAEMMTLVNRALERVPSDEDHLLSKRVMLTFPDCKSGDWFYIAVQEATNSHTYERAATEKNGDEQ